MMLPESLANKNVRVEEVGEHQRAQRMDDLVRQINNGLMYLSLAAALSIL